ncbi:MAG: NAD(P)-dependent oxidoreductase [Desulfobacterales bacterium]|nr:NAD(P)-dependent oxidoreductase [Desulfobacterales bacterium]
MKSVMLTGATGFIGSHLAARLLSEKTTTRLFVRRTNNLIRSLENQGARIYIGKAHDHATLQRSLAGVDTVIHCAAATRALTKKDYLAANVDFTRNILCLLNQDQRFIFISSQAAAGPSGPTGPIDEESKPRPCTYYGKSKLLAENQVREWGASHSDNYVILRPCIVYGPRERDLFNYFKMIDNGFDIMFGDRGKEFSMLYVSDLVSAALLAAEGHVAGATFFVANDSGYSWEEIGSRIKAVLNRKKVLRIQLPEYTAYPLALLLDGLSLITRKPALLNRQKIIEMKQTAWLCNNKKIKESLGWAPQVSLGTGLRRTAAWYRQEGWLRS